MYYYLPKAAGRPVFSYRLSILHFWSLVFIYIWAGPHHLHYTALPEWASTLGMLFSIMLWMPSWGGMINGLLTLRGAWSKVAAEPILKFFVVGITFYGMSTFEGPLLSVKSVNALSHYTDWTIAHVHAGALGWVGFMTFGMLYWLMPRMFQARCGARSWPICTSGSRRSASCCTSCRSTWRADARVDVAGDRQHGRPGLSRFHRDGARLMPMYWLRVLGGSLYLAGGVLCGVNCLKTMAARPAVRRAGARGAPLARDYVEPPKPESRLKGAAVLGVAHSLDIWSAIVVAPRWERRPFGSPSG
jgi:cytochrome c oxidase cbb3-type subunit I/II